MEVLLIWLACGILSAVVAESKGRSGLGWFLLGLVFGVFALLASVGVSKLEKQNPSAKADTAGNVVIGQLEVSDASKTTANVFLVLLWGACLVVAVLMFL